MQRDDVNGKPAELTVAEERARQALGWLPDLVQTKLDAIWWEVGVSAVRSGATDGDVERALRLQGRDDLAEQWVAFCERVDPGNTLALLHLLA